MAHGNPELLDMVRDYIDRHAPDSEGGHGIWSGLPWRGRQANGCGFGPAAGLARFLPDGIMDLTTFPPARYLWLNAYAEGEKLIGAVHSGA